MIIRLPVFAGKEGDRQTYVTKLTYPRLVELFDVYPSEGVPGALKRQRDLIPQRTKKISKYLVANDDFIFPEVIGMVKEFTFEPDESVAPGFGWLVFDDGVFKYLSDGQGRLTGIAEAMEKKPSIAECSIDIKFVRSESLERDQQVFADVNSNLTRPSSSQCITFDSRSVAHSMTKEMLTRIEGVQALIDFEKASVGKATPYLWTINQITNFFTKSQGITKTKCDDLFANEADQEKILKLQTSFFKQLSAKLDVFVKLEKGDFDPQSIKEHTIIGTAVFLEALGVFMKVAQLNMIEQGSIDLEWKVLSKLNNVNFNQENHEWIGRCFSMYGKFTKNQRAVNATAAYLIKMADLPMPQELQKIEDEVQASRSSVTNAA